MSDNLVSLFFYYHVLCLMDGDFLKVEETK